MIAALNGAVTGGGLVIATAAHVRCQPQRNSWYAYRRTRQLFGSVEFTSAGGFVWWSRVAHMILTAELLDADALLASGFVHELLDDKPALMARATEIATRMTAMAPLTIAASLEDCGGYGMTPHCRMTAI